MDRQDSGPSVYVDAHRQSVDGRARVRFDRDLSGNKRLRSRLPIGVRNHSHLAVAALSPMTSSAPLEEIRVRKNTGVWPAARVPTPGNDIYNLPAGWEAGRRTQGRRLVKHLGLPDCAEFLNRIGARIEFAASGDLHAAIGCQYGDLRSAAAVKNKRTQSKGASGNRQGNRHYLEEEERRIKICPPAKKAASRYLPPKLANIDA